MNRRIYGLPLLLSAKKAAGKAAVLRPRLRVMCGREIALGPGRIDLLELVGKTGSLRAAAEKMGMSYMRAWTLVQDLNRDPEKPMIEMARGGNSGGTATLTKFGKKVLTLYQGMDAAATKASRSYGLKLAELLK